MLLAWRNISVYETNNKVKDRFTARKGQNKDHEIPPMAKRYRFLCVCDWCVTDCKKIH